MRQNEAFYRFRLPLWYLVATIVCPSFYRIRLPLWYLVATIVCPSFYRIRLPLWYLVATIVCQSDTVKRRTDNSGHKIPKG
jgi:hypothetical protein